MEIAKIINGNVQDYPVAAAEVEAAVIAAQTGDGPFYFKLEAGSDQLDLSEFGFFSVEPVDAPATSIGQVAEVDGIEQYAPGKWRRKYEVRNRTAAELLEAKNAKKDAIRALRWEKEIGGATFNGVPIRTDEGSRNKISGTVSLFDKDPTMTVVDFEAQPDVWIVLDQPTMEALGVFVGRHVQQCFSHSKALMASVDAFTSFDDLAAFDIAEGWPE